MRLWTYHPSDYRLDAPNLSVDYTKGMYWRSSMRDFAYREVLPQLQRIVGTTQFLWCLTKRDEHPRTTEDIDSEEWELDVPLAHISHFLRVDLWENLVWSRGVAWDGLLVPVGDVEPTGSELDDLNAIVCLPLKAGWIICHRPGGIKYPNR